MGVDTKFSIGHEAESDVNEVRKVWGALSAKTEYVSVRDLAVQTNISKTRTFAILKFLVRCGYVKQVGKNRPYSVVIPFVEVKNQ